MTTTTTAPSAPPVDGRDAAPITAFGPARATVPGSPLSADEVRKIDAYWRACNYLALGMTYLKANPLLKEPLKPEHVKDRLLGHWGPVRAWPSCTPT
jgi:xylulose-5-phosphate/fructose-6-phosphate phosphoketolase